MRSRVLGSLCRAIPSRVVVRSLIWAVCGALVVLGAPGSASATLVTVVMTGQLATASDPAGATDGSLTAGATYTLTLTYDDATADLAPLDTHFGDFRVPAALSSYVVTVGNYTFSAAGGLSIAIEDNNAFGEDSLGWFTDQFSIAGALPPGVGPGAVTYSSIQLVDSSGTAHGSDRLTDLTWNRALYGPDDFAFYLAVQLAGPGIGSQQGIELVGSIASMSIVPEASASVMLASSLVGLAVLRRRRL